MGRIFGLLGLVVALAIGAYVYSRHVQSLSPAGTSNIRANVDMTGIRGDLLALANAERRHFATEAKYVSLDDLISAGDISDSRKSRGPYTYAIDFTETTFRVSATCAGDPQPGMPRVLSIDDKMEFRSE